MKQKRTAGISPKHMKVRTIFSIVSMGLIVCILAGLYLHFAWNRYSHMAKDEALQLAQSVEALLHPEHIAALALDDSLPALAEAATVEQSLVRLVETTDWIYYAYILKQQSENIVVIADSSAAVSDTSNPTKRSCEETAEINRLPFETGQSILAEPVSLPCGVWIRALVPIFDSDNKNVIAVLGLSYSDAEWQASVWGNMVHEFIMVAGLLAIVLILFDLWYKHSKLKKTAENLAFQETVFGKMKVSQKVSKKLAPQMA